MSRDLMLGRVTLAVVLLVFTPLAGPVSAQRFECPAVGAPVKDIEVSGFYSDPAGSIVDRDRFKEAQAEIEPLRRFNEGFLALADRYVESGDDAARACAYGWLSVWARGGALLGKMSTKGQYQRTVALSSISLGLLKFASRPGARLPPEVREWLLAVAQKMVEYHSRRKVKNNLFYWAGAAAAATSLATGEKRFWRFASDAYDTGVDAIGDDGTLPFELARGQRATSYHSLAAGGLVLLARLGRMHGDDMFRRRDERIHRLVALVFRATQDPSLLDSVVGVKQRQIASLPWLPLYQSAFPSRVPEAVRAMPERAWYQYLGGNVRALDRVLK